MKPYFFIFYLVTSLLTTLPASATSVLPITLEQLSTRASLIFYGEVISNQAQRDAHSGQVATFTEFKIFDLIKGSAAGNQTIKQLGGLDKNTNINFHVHGIPKFQNGSRYVVFLPERSSLGFSSPLGLHQGSFTVTTENGEQVVSNGRNLTPQKPGSLNKSVLLPLPVNIDKPSQSRLDDFINTVRAFNTP
jgi:hypothetical protein